MKNKKRKKQGKVGENKSETVRNLPKACADEDAAVEFVERLRWEGKPSCPRCGDSDVYRMMSPKNKKRVKYYRWNCHACVRQFSVRTGTIMEDSRVPMRHWCFAYWQAASNKKGVSAKQIQRQTGLSYKSALFLLHRIRYGMIDDNPPKLTGIIEADETYIGGKKRRKGTIKDRGKHKKIPVFAAAERGGEVRTKAMKRVTVKTVRRELERMVEKGQCLNTDEAPVYKQVGRVHFQIHEAVMHKIKEYARQGHNGLVTTNSVESFFALVKRSLHGIYHSVSKKHLPSYLSEFSFRYNTRRMDDGERTIAAIRGGVGKRLYYFDHLNVTDRKAS